MVIDIYMTCVRNDNALLTSYLAGWERDSNRRTSASESDTLTDWATAAWLCNHHLHCTYKKHMRGKECGCYLGAKVFLKTQRNMRYMSYANYASYTRVILIKATRTQRLYEHCPMPSTRAFNGFMNEWTQRGTECSIHIKYTHMYYAALSTWVLVQWRCNLCNDLGIQSCDAFEMFIIITFSNKCLIGMPRCGMNNNLYFIPWS